MQSQKLDFQSLILSQDAIEGYWKENTYTKNLINDNMQMIYDKVKHHIDSFCLGRDISIKLLYTFIVVYYVLHKQKDLIEEVSWILSKGKNFMKLNYMNYEDIIKNVINK